MIKKNPELAEPIHAAAKKLEIDEDKLLDYIEPELLDITAGRPVLVEASIENDSCSLIAWTARSVRNVERMSLNSVGP